jgi:hypothetical protein
VSGRENQQEQPTDSLQAGTVIFIVPMNDHEIIGRHDEGELAAVTQSEKCARRQLDHRDDEIVDEADPPKIPVAPTGFQNLSPRRLRVGPPGRCDTSETAPIRSASASASTVSSSAVSISSERSRTSLTSVIACQILSTRPSFCSLSIGMIKGVADASLYQRLTAHGLKELKCFPQLVSMVPGSERIERYQQQILAALTSAEAATWHLAVATAERDGTFFIAQPYHCAVAIKPG